MTERMTQEEMLELARRMAKGIAEVTGKTRPLEVVAEFEAGIISPEVKPFTLREQLRQILEDDDEPAAQ